MELDTRSIHRRGLTLPPVNKVHHVYTISRVAKMLGEDEGWLWDIATDMDQEDGLIWVHGPNDDGVMAFTDFGIETLTELIQIHRARKAGPATTTSPPCGPRRMLTVLRDLDRLQQAEVGQGGKTWTVRTDVGATASALLRACGIAVPPRIQGIPPPPPSAVGPSSAPKRRGRPWRGATRP